MSNARIFSIGFFLGYFVTMLGDELFGARRAGFEGIAGNLWLPVFFGLAAIMFFGDRKSRHG